MWRKYGSQLGWSLDQDRFLAWHIQFVVSTPFYALLLKESAKMTDLVAHPNVPVLLEAPKIAAFSIVL
jgi:hypothetical protein